MAHTGSEEVLEAASDWTLIGFRALPAQFDSTWDVFADRLVHPTLDSTSIAIVRRRNNGRRARESIGPNGAIEWLADRAAFAGHPYGLNPKGDERSLATLTAAAVRQYAHDQFVTSRMLLVIVGNVSRATVERAVSATLGSLPTGTYSWRPPPLAAVNATTLTLVQRTTLTNSILGYFQGPPVTSKDYQAFHVATMWLGSRLYDQIRRRYNLSYSAYAPYMPRAVATGGIYATSGAPRDVMILIGREVADLKSNILQPDQVSRYEREFVADDLASTASCSAQAASLGEAQIYQGDYRNAETSMQAILRVHAADIQRAARTYMSGIQLIYLGDTTLVHRSDISGL